MKKHYDKVELTLRIVCIVSSILFVAGIIVDCILCNNTAYEQYSSLVQNITGLCANLAVSYLFFIIAFLPENRKKQSVTRIINDYIRRLEVEYKEIVKVCDQIGDSKITLKDSPYIRTIIQEDNDRIFWDYYQHFIYFYNKSIELKNELLPFSDYLDDSLRNLVHQYVNARFFINIKSMLIDNPSDIQNDLFIKNINSMCSELKSIGKDLFRDRS